MSHSLFLVILLLGLSELSGAGNILVLPGEYSHWHNMRAIVEELVSRDHNVTVLVHSASPTVKFSQEEKFRIMTFTVDMDEHEADGVTQKLLSLWLDQNVSSFQKFMLFWGTIEGMSRFYTSVCDGLFLHDDLVMSLRTERFDVLLYDPMMPCADLLAQVLELPLVMSLRLSLAYSAERLCGQMPAPPSYVPAAGANGHLTDRMDFTERVQNMLLYILHTALFRLHVMLNSNRYFTEIMGKVHQSLFCLLFVRFSCLTERLTHDSQDLSCLLAWCIF